MTIERRIVVGLNDIQAVSFECNKCFTKTTVPAEKLRGVPETCPSCNAVWIARQFSQQNHVEMASAYKTFTDSLVKIRTLMENGAPFKILLEFSEPKGE
jgi:protein-arginine kinase activator protein McsA